MREMQKSDLKSILQNGYNRPQWISTLQFLSGNSERLTVFLEPRQVELQTKKAQNVARFLSQIGTLKTKEGDVLPLFEVQLQEKTHIEHNRVGVNELIKDFILQDAKRGALVTYHYLDNSPKEWRFSFISKYGGSDFFEEAASIETNPKKYTYIFGTDEEHRTAIDRLLILKTSDFKLEDFFEAFNVEPISTGFFKEYKRFYVDFVRSISGEEIAKKEWRQVEEPSPFYTEVFGSDSKEVRNFVKRLLGRLVFLYFLQKKRWLGAASQNYDDGDTNFLQNLFNAEQTNKESFYADWLTKLFFDTLNNPERKEESFELPSGATACVPFLNGGLFEEQQEQKNHRTLTFPTYLFEELFAFFNSYNFTIYENSPEDHIIAVDPEMLGNIFENLLEDNNASGTFYTPKEIVHYMTQESLIEYLATQMPYKERSELVDLIKNQNRDDFNRNELKTVFEKIDTVKVCDPAIGSGAFPMGLLQEIFSLKAFLNYEEGFGVKSPAIIKQNIIQNSIYGVDKEPGAIDIARLRFWLSLVVDEPTPKPLPNLDYKIMQGDSLREKFEGIDLEKAASESVIDVENGQRDIWGNLVDGQLKVTYGKTDNAKELQKLTKKYYTASVHEKPGLKDKINELVHEFIEYNIEQRELQLTRLISEIQGQKTNNPKIAKKLKEWKEELLSLEISRNSLHLTEDKGEHPYFLWHLFFKEVFDEGGFDIVIGNPPYIQLQSMGDYSKQLQEEEYITFGKTSDIYCLFYEKGFDLLNNKGILTYITSNKWMRAGYGKSLRRYFLENASTLQLIDFGDAQIFENATTYTNIYIGKKGKVSGESKVWDLSGRFEKKSSLVQLLQSNNDFNFDFSDSTFLIAKKYDLWLKDRIEAIGLPLKNWNVEINYGIKTGLNDAFIINESDRNDLIKKEALNSSVLKPIIRGRNIKRYQVEEKRDWLICTHNGYAKGTIDEIEPIKIDDYGLIKKSLNNYYNELISRKDQGITPYNLRSCAYLDDFGKQKLIWLEMSPRPNFTFHEGGLFVLNTAYILTGSSLKYLLAVLNSKLLDKYFSYIATDVRGATRRYTKQYVEQLPVPEISEKEQAPFEIMVDYILEINKIGEKEPLNEYVPNKHIAQQFEEVIDGMVFELYFSEDFKQKQISFREYVQRDFRSISEIESVSEKKRIIHEAYQMLRDKHNEIRNNLKLMDIRLHDLVMPIKTFH